MKQVYIGVGLSISTIAFTAIFGLLAGIAVLGLFIASIPFWPE